MQNLQDLTIQLFIIHILSVLIGVIIGSGGEQLKGIKGLSLLLLTINGAVLGLFISNISNLIKG